MAKEIIFTFHRNGTVGIAPHGFPGETCKEATKAYEKALGGAGSSTPTEEMNMSAEAVLEQERLRA